MHGRGIHNRAVQIAQLPLFRENIGGKSACGVTSKLILKKMVERIYKRIMKWVHKAVDGQV